MRQGTDSPNDCSNRIYSPLESKPELELELEQERELGVAHSAGVTLLRCIPCILFGMLTLCMLSGVVVSLLESNGVDRSACVGCFLPTLCSTVYTTARPPDPAAQKCSSRLLEFRALVSGAVEVGCCDPDPPAPVSPAFLSVPLSSSGLTGPTSPSRCTSQAPSLCCSTTSPNSS